MNLASAITNATALLRSQMDEIAVCRRLVAQGVDRPTAARLVEFLPMVYCRLLLTGIGLQFPETYRRALPDGTTTPPTRLSRDPLWNELMSFARSEITGGVEGQQLLAIAGRSAEFDAVNQLLNRGSKPADLRLTETVLMWPE